MYRELFRYASRLILLVWLMLVLVYGGRDIQGNLQHARNVWASKCYHLNHIYIIGKIVVRQSKSDRIDNLNKIIITFFNVNI